MIVTSEKQVRLKVKEVEEETFSVNLSREEALALVAVARHVGGSPDGPRGVVDSLSNGLVAKLGIESPQAVDELNACASGSVYIEPIQPTSIFAGSISAGSIKTGLYGTRF